MFQGDTLSPLIFLMAFNPIICLAHSLSTCGFSLKLSTGTPCTLKLNSFVYVFWDEPDSEEPLGWYLSKVISIFDDDTVEVLYKKGQTREVVKLSEIQWCPARGTDKWLRVKNNTPPENQLKLSKPHKVKGFADDLTIISSSKSDHSLALQQISSSCSDLDLRLKPAKCVSLVFDGKKFDKSACFPISSENTRNISCKPTKFLGHLQGVSNKQTSIEAGKKFSYSFQSKLTNLDQANIRGE